MEQSVPNPNFDILKLVRNAVRIEALLAKEQQKIKKISPENLARISTQLNYDNAQLDIEFAMACLALGISQEGFNKGVEARRNIPSEDKIMDIGRIDGKDVGVPGYYMEKLKRNDPRILLVGQFTGCCNHIDGGTRTMAIGHVVSPYGGCYALFKNGENGAADTIIGKTSVWIGKEKDHNHNKIYDLCFNSWERRVEIGNTNIAVPFLREAARRVLKLDPQIDRVLLGRNRDGFPFNHASNPAEARDPQTASYDSCAQYLITSRRLLEIEEEAEKKGDAKKETLPFGAPRR